VVKPRVTAAGRELRFVGQTGREKYSRKKKGPQLGPQAVEGHHPLRGERAGWPTMSILGLLCSWPLPGSAGARGSAWLLRVEEHGFEITQPPVTRAFPLFRQVFFIFLNFLPDLR
jgi:hypothetical protein